MSKIDLVAQMLDATLEMTNARRNLTKAKSDAQSVVHEVELGKEFDKQKYEDARLRAQAALDALFDAGASIAVIGEQLIKRK